MNASKNATQCCPDCGSVGGREVADGVRECARESCDRGSFEVGL